jgi:hypothetical protein
MMAVTTQRISRNRVWHMMQQQQPLPPEYPPDNGSLTDSQIEQLKNTARTKYA